MSLRRDERRILRMSALARPKKGKGVLRYAPKDPTEIEYQVFGRHFYQRVRRLIRRGLLKISRPLFAVITPAGLEALDRG